MKKNQMPYCPERRIYVEALNEEVFAYEEDVANALIKFTQLPPSRENIEVSFRGVMLPIITFMQIIRKTWLEKKYFPLRAMYTLHNSPERVDEIEKFLMQLPFSNMPECPKEVREWLTAKGE